MKKLRWRWRMATPKIAGKAFGREWVHGRSSAFSIPAMAIYNAFLRSGARGSVLGRQCRTRAPSAGPAWNGRTAAHDQAIIVSRITSNGTIKRTISRISPKVWCAGPMIWRPPRQWVPCWPSSTPTSKRKSWSRDAKLFIPQAAHAVSQPTGDPNCAGGSGQAARGGRRNPVIVTGRYTRTEEPGPKTPRAIGRAAARPPSSDEPHPA